MQLAVLQVQPQAVRVAQVAVAGRRQTRAARQRQAVHFQHRALGRYAANAVLAFAVADQRGAVVQHQAHARDAQFFGVLDVVVVAVHEDLADHAGLGGEHAAADLHAVSRFVGGHRAAQRVEGRIDAAGRHAASLAARAVDAVALHRAHVHPHAVAQHELLAGGHGAEVEGQGRTDTARACGRRIGDGRVTHHGRALDVGEARRQAVDHRGLARQSAGRDVDGDGVAHRVADFGHGLVAGLAERDGAGQCRVQRNVVVDDVGAAAAAGQRQEVAGARAHGSHRRRGLRLHRVHRTRAARRHQRPGRWRDGGGLEAVAGRRCDGQAEGAAGRRAGAEEELVVTVSANGHGRAAAAQRVAAQGGADQAGAGVPAGARANRRQRDDGTGHGCAQARVVDHATGVDRHALLRQFLARREDDGQRWRVARADAGTGLAAGGGRGVANRAAGAGRLLTVDGVAKDDARSRVAEAHGQRHAGHQAGDLVAAVAGGGGATDDGARVRTAVGVDDFDQPAWQAAVAGVQQARRAADVVPSGA